MCHWWFENGPYYIRVLIYSNTSLFQFKETIRINLEFENSVIIFFLKVLHFLRHFINIYVLFYIIGLSEYRQGPVRKSLWVDGTLKTFVNLLNGTGVILNF